MFIGRSPKIILLSFIKNFFLKKKNNLEPNLLPSSKATRNSEPYLKKKIYFI